MTTNAELAHRVAELELALAELVGAIECSKATDSKRAEHVAAAKALLDGDDDADAK